MPINTVAKHPTEGRSAASRTCVSSSPFYQLWVGFQPPYPQTRMSVDAGIMYSQSFTVKPAGWVKTFQVSRYLAAAKRNWWSQSSFGATVSEFPADAPESEDLRPRLRLYNGDAPHYIGGSSNGTNGLPTTTKYLGGAVGNHTSIFDRLARRARVRL